MTRQAAAKSLPIDNAGFVKILKGSSRAVKLPLILHRKAQPLLAERIDVKTLFHSLVSARIWAEGRAALRNLQEIHRAK
jgi:hypothetical protein